MNRAYLLGAWVRTWSFLGEEIVERNRDYYETQNYFESRITPDAPIIARIHATPGYPLTAIAGITLHFGGK